MHGVKLLRARYLPTLCHSGHAAASVCLYGLTVCALPATLQAAAYHGHWVSQRAARWLAGGEVLFSQYEGR